MKRNSSSVSVAVLFLAVAVSARPDAIVERQYRLAPRMSPDQELIKLENEWAEAIVRCDVAFLDRILAADYTRTDPNGNVRTKADEMASLKSAKGTVTSAVNDEMKVRVYGDAAVVTGRTTKKGTMEGQDVGGQFRWTEMWVKDYAGRWQCVATHSSRIAQK